MNVVLITVQTLNKSRRFVRRLKVTEQQAQQLGETLLKLKDHNGPTRAVITEGQWTCEIERYVE